MQSADKPTRPAHGDRSLWWAANPAVSPTPLLNNITVDVCVVGGGVTGLSTAWHLRRADPGARIALLEADQVGFGASGRNAGQALVQFGGDWSTLLKRQGASDMRAGLDYVHEGIRVLDWLADTVGLDFDYARTGTMKVGLQVDGPGPIEAYRDFQHQAGQGAFLTHLSADQVQEEINSPYLGEGIYDPRGGTLDPLKLVRGLKRLAQLDGVEIFEDSPVAQLIPERPLIRLETGRGSVRCRKVVLALNGYAHLLPGGEAVGLRRRQRPLMVKATATAPITPEQWGTARWGRRCGINVVSDLFFSFAPTADGRVVSVGGYYVSAPGDRALTPEVDWRLKAEASDHLGAFFPALRDVPTAHTWGGPISLTRDMAPYVGESQDPRILYACGCWGAGLPLGLRNGATLADLALDRRTPATDLWFVRRGAVDWPPLVSHLAAGQVIATQRRRSRLKAARMAPPLRFQT